MKSFISLLVGMINFNKKINPKNPDKKQKKKYILKNLYALFDGRERVLDAFESKIFPIIKERTGFLDLACTAKVSDRKQDKVSDHSNLKILSPKQMFQRLPIALVQVKAGSTCEKLRSEIRKVIYSLYQAKEITKKV